MTGAPPTPLCRPILLSLSAGEARRQADLGAGYHLLDCEFCAELSQPLVDRTTSEPGAEVRTAIRADADIVAARQAGRDLAIRAGFGNAESTVIATAISEIARNIVRFARRGEIVVTIINGDERPGIRVVARDVGAGISDLDQAMEVGYSTYGGRGLGLPGTRRMMDDFEIHSQPGRGTTVTMTKWRWL
jgi:serine/threonine-protein kinase RsbT